MPKVNPQSLYAFCPAKLPLAGFPFPHKLVFFAHQTFAHFSLVKIWGKGSPAQFLQIKKWGDGVVMLRAKGASGGAKGMKGGPREQAGRAGQAGNGAGWPRGY
jgi:hypothetical protein